MQQINVISEAFEMALRQLPELRGAAMSKATSMMRERVRAEISGRLNDSHGKIAGWQTTRIGSGKGYGVVEADNEKSGRNSPGAITNYLESGHKIRTPRERGAKGYRPRIRVASVSGRWFYRAASADAERILLNCANEVCASLAHTLGGD